MTVHGFAKLRPTSYKCNLFAASAAPAGRAWTTLPLELGYARITNYISCRWTAHESPPYSLHSRLQRRSLGSGLPTPQPPKLRDLSILFYSVQDPRPRLQVSLLLFLVNIRKIEFCTPPNPAYWIWYWHFGELASFSRIWECILRSCTLFYASFIKNTFLHNCLTLNWAGPEIWLNTRLARTARNI